jgi:hypothetical protein
VICEAKDVPSYEFYIWLLKNTKYITDFTALMRVYKLFQGKNFVEYDKLDFTIKTTSVSDMNAIHKIMKDEGFIFA